MVQQGSKKPFVWAAALVVAAVVLNLATITGLAVWFSAVVAPVLWAGALVCALVGLIRLADGVDYLAARERERQQAEDRAYVAGLSRASVETERGDGPA